ncbi:MAG TPA: lysylphosphatidylglycerol synthase transmembrane domain-containing protein [Solirubrobacteraceae bacterium]|nr:lysylphosphatidylglycerol synthase transmembrane domain-containing protein [Solirubrobacteraceae bacterium]
MRRQLRKWPVGVSAVAMGIAGIAVVVIARTTGADAVGRAFADIDPAWIALIAGAEALTYPAYMMAYRSLAQVHGHPPMSLPLVARVVVAGFGPFAIGGGFEIDKQALHGLHEDERSARVRVLALGVLEWTVLAPVACIVSIILLLQGADVMASLLWPWAIAVPAGFAFALWASAPERAERLSRIRGKRREWLAQPLDGVGVLRTLVSKPRTYAGAWVGTILYWAADIAAFYGALRTFGLHPGAGKVIIAYATGYAATRRSLPLGGAGVTEFLMTYSLYWVRLPLAPSLAAVLAYRVFNLVVVSAPALIAHRQLESVLAAADALRLAKRTPRRRGK